MTYSYYMGEGGTLMSFAIFHSFIGRNHYICIVSIYINTFFAQITVVN